MLPPLPFALLLLCFRWLRGMERGTEWPSCFSECLEQLEEEPKDPEKELQVTAWVP